jgi:hypothetical protein
MIKKDNYLKADPNANYIGNRLKRLQSYQVWGYLNFKHDFLLLFYFYLLNENHKIITK